MSIDYDYLMSLAPLVSTQRYSARDTMLYALAVGAGRVAVRDSRALRFVYERELVALPTQATVLAHPGFWAQDPKYGITCNPLQADPAVARSAGFERPILHGLATFGLMGLGAVCQLCGYAPQRVRRMDARFAAPAHPGETFEIDIWRTSDCHAVFEGRVIERGIKVIRNGYLEFEC